MFPFFLSLLLAAVPADKTAQIKKVLSHFHCQYVRASAEEDARGYIAQVTYKEGKEQKTAPFYFSSDDKLIYTPFHEANEETLQKILAPPPVRLWLVEGTKGIIRIRGSFVSQNGNAVTLKEDNKLRTVSYLRLSPQDRAFLHGKTPLMNFHSVALDGQIFNPASTEDPFPFLTHPQPPEPC